jgi:hypothetical protein
MRVFNKKLHLIFIDLLYAKSRITTMKKKLCLLLFSLMLSFNSYGQWVNVLPGNNASLYIDFKTLQERDGFIYWWYMDSWGEGSEQSYAQGDCNLKGFKVNKRVKFSLPMGEGESTEKNITSSWEYYQPNSSYEILLNFICQMSRLTPEEQKIRIEALTKRNEEFEKERREFVKEREDEKNSPQLNTLNSPYIKSIDAKIRSFWRHQNAEDNWSCDVVINQAGNGAVEAVRILECDVGNNENPAMSKSKAQKFATSIRRAVFKSSPLPLPLDEAVFDREVVFKFSVK